MIIILGSLVTLAIFLLVGWAVSAEMFQQRWWRRKVAAGDIDIIGALIEEAMAHWRRSRIPKEMPGNRWAAIQSGELLAATPGGATFSASVVSAYETDQGRRVKTSSDREEAVELAVRLLDLVLYDVPNLRLSEARVDIYANIESRDGREQQPILSVVADRMTADELNWDELTAEVILGLFETIMAQERDGEIIPIELPPIEGDRPRPAEEAAAEALQPPGKQA